MKYLIVVLDGLSENQTNGLTTMQQAKMPNLDKMYQFSTLGLVNCIRPGYNVASDVANMSILGYDPVEYYSGRAFLEAKAHDIELANNQVVYRANLVKMSEEQAYLEKTMIDFSANNILSSDAYTIIDELNNELVDSSYFVKGSSYHHLLITENNEHFDIVAPHEITGNKIYPYFKDINTDNYFFQMMQNSSKLINNRYGATSLWLWSPSKAVKWPSFSSKYQIKGAMISAVDALIGIGKLALLDYVKVPGATGDNNTAYDNKIDTALKLLDAEYDLVFLHIEACDYCSHQGNQIEKIKAIEAIDNKVISKILNYQQELRVLLLPDHHTSCQSRMHESGEVPLMIYDNSNKVINNTMKYQEKNFINAKKYQVLSLVDLLIKG